MSPELDEKLCRDFPLLYADRYSDMKHTCMCWGFCCEDGWEPLIRRLSEKIEAILADMTDPGTDQGKPKAAQVKEKFGTLRFYMTWEHEEIRALIREAEHESAHTCELCGSTTDASVRPGGWIRTLCGDCNAKR